MCQQGGSLEVSPARYQLVHELKKLKYKVYVFCNKTIQDKNIRNDIDCKINTSYFSASEIRNKIINIQPNIVIATTVEDTLILYPLVIKMKNSKFIYYNLEIYTPEEEMYKRKRYNKEGYHIAYIKNKIREILYNQHCDLLVIQDSLRKKVSSRYFISNRNTMLIPNSYTYCEENTIECNRYGIIYSGGMGKLRLATLLENIDNFPDLPITFSGWGNDWCRNQIKKLKVRCHQIEFNEINFDLDKWNDYLNRFAVGLIWYCTCGNDNNDNIGLASGKFFKHLSLGQPVITLENPILGNIVRKYKLGVVVKDVSELQNAYEHIMKNYSFYQNNIRQVYKDKFDYAKVIQPFLKYLEAN
jgi:hypothetical protein